MKPNVERLKQLSTALGVEHGFNMQYWAYSEIDTDAWKADKPERTECGTVCCIGGLASVMFCGLNPPSYEGSNATDAPISAGKALGLEGRAAHDLFYPSVLSGWHKITIPQAQKAIQNVIDHGEPRWLEVVK